METFVTLKPENKSISKYIAYYYFHRSDDVSSEKAFVFYPNYKNAITVYKGSEVNLVGNGSSIVPANDDRLEILYTTNIKEGKKVFLKGIFNKIGIVFQPLGLNYFLEKSLVDIVDSRVSKFQYFGKEFEEICKIIFEKAENSERVMVLDSFFESKLSNFHNPILQRSVDEIIASNGMIKVGSLAEMFLTNRKTLLRLFQKHLLCSVEEYKKLVKFRYAVNFSQTQLNSLTEVALSGQYYDQADFINQFKSIANESPSKVIPAISKLGNEEIYWKFFAE